MGKMKETKTIREHQDSAAEIRKSYCGICTGECPIDCHFRDGKLVYVEASKLPDGKVSGLCPKGVASVQFEYNKERLLYPMRRKGPKGSGKFERISWDEAFSMLAENLNRIKAEHGAESVIFYAGYPKWYRPALLHFANAFGSPNYCTESSTCFQAFALSWRLTFGGGPCFPDLRNCRTLLVWSRNSYLSDISQGPAYRALGDLGVKRIVVDPRNTVTAHEADLHLAPLPGTDGALALAMGQVILEEGLEDRAFIESYVHGFDEYAEYVKQFPPERAEAICGVPAAKIREAARLYATEKPSAIMFSAAPVVHNINGVQNYRAVEALIAITGNYDVEGGNRAAMGPRAPMREFGQVLRKKDIEAIGEKDFPVWFNCSCEEAQCTRLADYIEQGKPYPLHAMFAMGLNHRMWPQPKHLQEALSKLDFLVNVDLFWSDSCLNADLLLPAATFFEREELLGRPGPVVCLRQPVMEPLGEARNDIEIIQEAMRRLRLFDAAGSEAVQAAAEADGAVRCTGTGDNGKSSAKASTRNPVRADGSHKAPSADDFRMLSGSYEDYLNYILEPCGLTAAELRQQREGVMAKKTIPPKTKCYLERPFDTPSGKIELYSEVLAKYKDSYGYDPLPAYRDYRENFSKEERKCWPLILATGSRRPQFYHARTYRMSWLKNLEPAAQLSMHPDDAAARGLSEGDEIIISSPVGEVEAVLHLDQSCRRGVVNIFHGNREADANDLISDRYLDPISGFPGYKSYLCEVRAK